MHAYRTHTCAQLRAANVGETVRLSGWIHRKRDHGQLVFIDLRDHYGLTQIVTDVDAEAFKSLEGVRGESVVTITGEVVARSAETINPNLPTGEIEVKALSVAIQSPAQELPMPVFGEAEYPEDIRLRYRYLDLRRERIHANIMLRSAVIASIRARMVAQGFTEFQTPILTASSPEGARDYLVPSRVHPGKFYALPQAPQMFKQLLMVAGFDRYFQIAPCFRDEDGRADRSPGEFYQLDFEMSFVTQEDVFNMLEPVLAGLFEEFANGKKVTPAGTFPRIPYAQAMLKYGSDKPDLRNPIVIADVTEHFDDSGFGLFDRITASGGVIRAIPAPTGRRPLCDRVLKWAESEGFRLAYITFDDGIFEDEWLKYFDTDDENVPEKYKSLVARARNGEEIPVAKGPVANNIDHERLRKIARACGCGPGDAVFMAAGKEVSVSKLAGLTRTYVGDQLGLINDDEFNFCWIVDFPMYEYDEDAKKIDFSHNPFSMPQGEMEALTTKDPLDILAYQYDIVCNGVELSSGAIRNHRLDLMYKAFEIAGYSQADVDTNFSGMINAFKYGAPPHGGSAPGIDRMVMLLAGEPNIREVVLFPMNQKAEDLMMGAPSEVSPKQLRELNIRIMDGPKG